MAHLLTLTGAVDMLFNLDTVHEFGRWGNRC